MAEPAADATELALRALRHRNRSRAELDRRLAQAGIEAETRAAALDRLTETGLVSDARFAEERARVLAGRGVGDAMIRADLRGKGIDRETAEQALAELEPEEARAERELARRGDRPKTLRRLAGKGFAPETLERLVSADALE